MPEPDYKIVLKSKLKALGIFDEQDVRDVNDINDVADKIWDSLPNTTKQDLSHPFWNIGRSKNTISEKTKLIGKKLGRHIVENPDLFIEVATKKVTTSLPCPTESKNLERDRPLKRQKLLDQFERNIRGIGGTRSYEIQQIITKIRARRLPNYVVDNLDHPLWTTTRAQIAQEEELDIDDPLMEKAIRAKFYQIQDFPHYDYERWTDFTHPSPPLGQVRTATIDVIKKRKRYPFQKDGKTDAIEGWPWKKTIKRLYDEYGIYIDHGFVDKEYEEFLKGVALPPLNQVLDIYAEHKARNNNKHPHKYAKVGIDNWIWLSLDDAVFLQHGKSLENILKERQGNELRQLELPPINEILARALVVKAQSGNRKFPPTNSTKKFGNGKLEWGQVVSAVRIQQGKGIAELIAERTISLSTLFCECVGHIIEKNTSPDYDGAVINGKPIEDIRFAFKHALIKDSEKFLTANGNGRSFSSFHEFLVVSRLVHPDGSLALRPSEPESEGVMQTPRNGVDAAELRR